MEQKIVKNFTSVIDAELAKNALEASGIKSVIQKQGFTGNGGIPAAGILGVDLSVLEKDYENAKKLLDSFQTKNLGRLEKIPLSIFVVWLYSLLVFIFPGIFSIIFGISSIGNPLLNNDPSKIFKAICLPIIIGFMLIGLAVLFIKKGLKR